MLLSGLYAGYGTLAYGRALVGGQGRLPDFLIIGAQRSGTSYLYDFLTNHPQVVKASHKEIHYFDREFHRGTRWYRGNFPTRAKREPPLTPYVYGEATPTYIAYQSIPARVREVVPDVRLIVLVRNPVERAISHYHHFRRLGYESQTLEEAVRWEYEYLSSGNPPLLLDSPGRRSDSLYLSLGMYSTQIRLWLKTFEERRLLVLVSEELFTKPTEALARVARFLGVADVAVQRPAPKQFGSSEISGDIPFRLAELFQPHNRDLETVIGSPLPWDN